MMEAYDEEKLLLNTKDSLWRQGQYCTYYLFVLFVLVQLLALHITHNTYAASPLQPSANVTWHTINGEKIVLSQALISSVTLDKWGTGAYDCNMLMQQGLDLYRQSQFQAALKKWEAALTCYQKIANHQGEGRAANNLGIIYLQWGQYATAKEYYEQALNIAREVNDREGESNALGNLGSVYFSLSQYQTAIEYHEQALSIARGIDARQNEANWLSGLAGDYFSLSQYQTAIEHYEQALDIVRQIGNRQSEGECLGNLGVVYLHLGDYTTAIEHYEQALTIAHESGDRQKEGNWLGNLGTAYQHLGQYTMAIEYFERALVIAREIGDRRSEGSWSGGLGSAYLAVGQIGIANEYYKQALVIAREIGDRQKEGIWLSGLGNIYRNLGENTVAINYYEQALVIAREIGDQQKEGSWLGFLGITYISIGQTVTAIKYFEQALIITREIGDPSGEVAHLHGLGSAYGSLGQFTIATEHFELAIDLAREIGSQVAEASILADLGNTYYLMENYTMAIKYSEQALSIAREIGAQSIEDRILGSLGNSYDSLGRYAKATKYYEQALAIARAIGDREGEAINLSNLGGTYLSMGHYAKAIETCEQAITFVERQRAVLNLGEFKSSFVTRYISSYQSMIIALIELSRFEDAFYYVQRAKARTLLDQMGNTRVNPRVTDDPALLAQEQALLDEIHGLQAVLSGQQDFASLDTHRGDVPPLSGEQRAEVSTRLEQAYYEYDQLLVQIQRTNPQYAALRTVQASTLITVQQTLPADVTLVEYYVLDTETLAFVVTQKDFDVITLDVSYQTISETLKRYEAETQASLEDIPHSMKVLYNLLFAAIREYIHTDAILIAPHGPLHYVAFGALHDGEHYLVENYIIGYIPSASMLRYINTSKPQHFNTSALVLGNPVNAAVNPLKGAEKEAQVIAKIFGVKPYLKGKATESWLWDNASEATYIHLAVHGSFNPIAPQFSRLYLTPSETTGNVMTDTLSTSHTDGLLEVREVWNLPLENADLVTLSACETQLGDLSAGDELVGLSRAFLYAGTSSLVASLWSVEDESTAFLMEHFYSYLKDGMGKAEALRQAQLDTMADYPSPYYWAAFTLMGDMGKVEIEALSTPTPSEDTGGRSGLCASATFPLMLLALVWVWRRN